jgi:thiamine-phosphate pyrophosphorylase
VQRYYITDRRGCVDIVQCIKRAATSGVDYIQIREKDLSARELLSLTRRAVEAVHGWPARILVNGRIDVALAAEAHGVHLPAGSIAADIWRAIVPAQFLFAVSCHSADEIRTAGAANFAVFGPVFPSPGKGPALGLQALEDAISASSVPVFALGGVNAQNAQTCIDAGASGIAAIRMFQE